MSQSVLRAEPQRTADGAVAAEVVSAAARFYDGFRRGLPQMAGPGFVLHRVAFESQVVPAASDAQWTENQRFVYPLFLPARTPPFRHLTVILNGLNDSSYRKFFPWAASLAASGMPVAIFPSAFLMNRRPRALITPVASHMAWLRRMELAPQSATPINAVLSERVAQEPLSLLRDQLQTAADLRQLIARVRGRGTDAYGVFDSDATVHFLGYSLGGYLALALRLEDAAFAASRVIAFCSGACANAPTPGRLAPTSPFILDQHAADALLGAAADAAVLALEDRLAGTLLELWTGTRDETRERIAALGAALTIVTGEGDQVIPSAGVQHNLGRIDRLLPIGVHEYPFNLDTIEGADLVRVAARAHRVEPRYEGAFREFVTAVLRGLPRHE